MTTDQNGRTTIPGATWSRLLAPDSGLITQSDKLRVALARLDGYTITTELRALHHGAHEQDRRVLDELAVFLRYTAAASRRGIHRAAAETRRTDMTRADLYDVRCLGALITGTARGTLPSNLHTEATDLVLDRLGPADAHRLTAPIRRALLTP